MGKLFIYIKIRFLLSTIFFFINFFSYSQVLSDYFVYNKYFYPLDDPDSLDYWTLKYFLENVEKCLKDVNEPNLKYVQNTTFRVIYLTFDTVIDYSFISRIWKKHNHYYKRDIAFYVKDLGDSCFYEIKRILLDTTYLIPKKKYDKILKYVSPEMFKNPNNIKPYFLSLNFIYEYKGKNYYCLYSNKFKYERYGKNFPLIFKKIKPIPRNTEHYKKLERTNYILIFTVLIFSSLIGILL